MQFNCNYLPVSLCHTGKPKHCYRVTQMVRIMKLLVILLTVAFLQVRADGFTQATVTFSGKDVALEKVISAIKRQTGYIFFYTMDIWKAAKPVTIDVKNVSIYDVMEIIMRTQPFTYIIENKTIVISEKKEIQSNSNKVEVPKTNIAGKVTDKEGNPLNGANVVVKGTTKGTTTDESGYFELKDINDNVILEISYVNYETAIVSIKDKKFISVQLNLGINELTGISVVLNTGYQKISKERATGSFDYLNNDLINRSISTNVLNRLDGVASGLVFNKNTSNTKYKNQLDISIRGRSTIFANDQPLIVVDNFAFDGDVNNINPNDVDNIVILKDAAAASIWGARAGNGVIVITTKKGKYNQPIKVSIIANLTIGQNPDLFYNPNFLNSSDYVDVETFLFSKNFYNANINGPNKPALSPVVEMLYRRKSGQISASDSADFISEMRSRDVRDDFERYIYRKSINQQYSVNFSGGSNKASYYFSSGFDKNQQNLINNNYQRVTLNSANVFTPFKGLEITAGINYITSTLNNNNSGWGNDAKYSLISTNPYDKNIYPYAKFADDNGTSLSIPRVYREAVLDTLGGGNLLDWRYRPIDEITLSNNTIKINQTRVNTGLKYSFNGGLSIDVAYQLDNQLTTSNKLNGSESYFTRNLVNQYTIIANGIKVNKIPIGGIVDNDFSQFLSQIIRGQINYDHTWNSKHQVSVIMGSEIRKVNTKESLYREYGYDSEHDISGKVDYNTPVNKIYPFNSFNQLVPNINAITETIDKYKSVYANASYTFDGRYTISGSVRRDASNLFGVETNQKVVPLWSSGVSWNLSKENFYKVSWLPYLKMKATYGYNGNVDKTVTAFTTARFQNSFLTGLQSAVITNPANPDLRWEKVKIVNIGFEFRTIKNFLSGSFEYYTKEGIDLIGDSPMPPASGVLTFRGNVAQTKGKGIDLVLHSNNLNGKFSWQTDLLLSHVTDKVTSYKTSISPINYVTYGDGTSNTFGSLYPVEGKPVYAIYSYKWGGLDSVGDPVGYSEKQKSKDYTSILYNTSNEDIVYNGSARPTVFGSLRNTISYKNLSLSINITYKLGYYFRRTALSYDDLYNHWVGNKDFANRWQKPGDEAHTNVPAMIYPEVNNRSLFYTLSEVLVEKGDHIRLQDLRISYDFQGNILKRAQLSNARIFVYANNLGIIWRANKMGLDPEASVFPDPKTISFGLQANF
jgi:TonB-linked SusC/RagA family outer membrane protein